MTSRHPLADLRAARPAILPSMLLCDFGALEREIARLAEAGAPGLHLDVMDGHFVPNLTYGMTIVAACRKLTDLPLDVHLMISDPAAYAEAFHEAGADHITFHIEAVPRPAELLRRTRELGMTAGLALNPETPLEAVLDHLDLCDVVLVMSVMPGFGGQAFDRRALDKLSRLRALVGPDQLLEVDGGVNGETIGECAAAGADLFVVGSAIFGGEDHEYTERISGLRRRAQTERVG